MAGLALTVVTGGRVRWSFLAVLAATAILAGMYMVGPMRAYAYLPIVFVSNLPWWQDAAIGLTLALALGALMVGVRSPGLRGGDPRRPDRRHSGLRGGVYALLPAAGQRRRLRRVLSDVRLLYLTLPALLAALFGYALLARLRFWRDPALFVTVAIFGVFFFYKIRIVPEQFWMARRFLPVILPGALLFASGAALAGTHSGSARTRVIRGALGTAFLLLLALQYLRMAAPLQNHVEYAGIIPKIEQLAAGIQDTDLLIVESRDASDTHVLGLPLAYIYDRNVLLLRSRVPDKSAFGSFLDWAHQRYSRVLFMGGGGTELLSRRWDVRPVAGERFQVPEFETSRYTFPRTVRRKEFDYSLYEFVTPRAGAPVTTEVDVGTQDDLHVLRFHAKET